MTYQRPLQGALTALLIALQWGMAHPDDGRRSGVVVTRVVEGQGAEAAGLGTGDVLEAWQRAPSPPANPSPAGGPIENPETLFELQEEQSSRGQVLLLGRRDQLAISAAMPEWHWGLRVRPRLDARSLAALRSAAVMEKECGSASCAGLQVLARFAEERGDIDAAVWARCRLARTLADDGQAEAGDASLSLIHI